MATKFRVRPLVGGDTIDEEYGINELPPLVEGDVSLSVEGIARALVNIYKGNVDIDHEVEEHLFQETSKIFNEAISEGYANAVENNTPLPNDTFRSSFKHSADVFSAFRVHRMQQDIAAQMIDEDGHVKPFQKFVKDVSPYIEHRNRAWLRTEYDTAILRAQNAAEWKMFEQEKDVYPNLEWIQSTSPDPGADHMIFWGTIRPVDDAFWNEHRPGDRWNCKCELQQSDSDVTAAPLSDGKSDPARGLESNPAKAEELFSQKHPYYPQSCMSCPFAGNKLMALAMELAGRKNCNRCGKVRKSVAETEKKSNRREYERLKKEPQYKDVQYDKKSGGVKATHNGHNEQTEKTKLGVSSAELEKHCQDILFKKGHRVIFVDEKVKDSKGRFLTQLDMLLDGKPCDIASVTTNRRHYGMVLVSKNKQIHRYNSREDITTTADTLCLYFHKASMYDEKRVLRSINYYLHFRKNDGKLIDHNIKTIHCVVNGNDEIFTFSVE